MLLSIKNGQIGANDVHLPILLHLIDCLNDYNE